MIDRWLAALRRLDAIRLPEAARWLRRVLAVVQAKGASMRARWSAALAPAPQPVADRLGEPEPTRALGHTARRLPGSVDELTASLRGLDERRARGGILGLLGDVPQLGAVVLAALVAASALVVAVHDGGNGGSAATDPRLGIQPADPRAGLLGIPPGTRVADYLDATSRRLKGAADATPNAERVALVSFTAYSAPAGAATLSAGTRVTRAFYLPRGGKGPTEPASVTITGALLPALTAAFRRAAGTLDQSALALERFAATIDPVTAEQRAQKAESVNDARIFRARAAQLRTGCACVFAVLVRAPVDDLVTLAARRGIRAVDLAPSDVPTDALDMAPLRPDVTTIATASP